MSGDDLDSGFKYSARGRKHHTHFDTNEPGLQREILLQLGEGRQAFIQDIFGSHLHALIVPVQVSLCVTLQSRHSRIVAGALG